jgi:hypothetical protein
MDKYTVIITGTDKDDVREKFHEKFPYGKITSMEVTEVTLGECPVGLFRYGNEIVLKTEYSDEAGCKCYLIRNGRRLGQYHKNLNHWLVEPLDIDTLGVNT